jgi:hypothetical protein
MIVLAGPVCLWVFEVEDTSPLWLYAFFVALQAASPICEHIVYIKWQKAAFDVDIVESAHFSFHDLL